MGGGESRWRRAAKRIGFLCASCFNETSPSHPPKIISCSAVNISADNTEGNQEKKETTILTDKNICAICLESLSCGATDGGSSGSGGDCESDRAIFTAQCSHSFHFLCIASNVRHGNTTCPICRAQWSQLPRDLTAPSSQHHADPILRILDDSIATSRVNRRSFLRSTRYNDDDPIDPTIIESLHPSLQFMLIPAPVAALSRLPGRSPSADMLVPQQCTSPNSWKRAYLSVRLAPKQATDLVLVASPNGPHLRLLKQSMALVVFSLRAIDRLAIVTCSTTATRAFPLKRMSTNGKRMALQIIDRLCYVGGADPMEGLQKGVKILEDRTHRNPLSCILNLSDSPTRARVGRDSELPFPIHQFHIGFGFGMSNGFVMHEFEEYLARVLGGLIRDTQLRIGDQGGSVRLGELRGGEERRIPLDLTGDDSFITVSYSYVEEGREEWQRTGEMVVGFNEKSERNNDDGGCVPGGRDLSIGGRSSCAERWDYLDPFMARRWAKHLHKA
ncbi:E3 ubiquitin-protein ligase WAV3-like [Typha latifolia]|uniref:E3 ubiquitin-protein ligase WAV3-like n=1 Tax=Typha latifolia TaxID=4733 RepID=UPI003C2AE811